MIWSIRNPVLLARESVRTAVGPPGALHSPGDIDPIAIRNVRALRRWRAKPHIALITRQLALQDSQNRATKTRALTGSGRATSLFETCPGTAIRLKRSRDRVGSLPEIRIAFRVTGV